MAAWTLEEARTNLAAAQAALTEARTHQGFAVNSTTGGRSVNKALHASLLDEVKFWRKEVAKLERGGIQSQQVTPL